MADRQLVTIPCHTASHSSPASSLGHPMSLFRILPLVLLTAPAVASEDRPNIIVIVTDDQSPFTLSTYGNRVCQTPHLDRMASDGLTFDAAYHMGAWLGAGILCLAFALYSKVSALPVAVLGPLLFLAMRRDCVNVFWRAQAASAVVAVGFLIHHAH